MLKTKIGQGSYSLGSYSLGPCNGGLFFSITLFSVSSESESITLTLHQIDSEFSFDYIVIHSVFFF